MGLVIPSPIIWRRPYYTQFMREITVQNNESFDLTSYPVEVTFAGAKPNFVITKEGDIIPHWIRRLTLDSVELYATTDLPASGTVILKVWYGGPTGYSLHPFMPAETNCFSCDFYNTDIEKWFDVVGDYILHDGWVEVGNASWAGLSVKGLSLQDMFVEVAIRTSSANYWVDVVVRDSVANNLVFLGWTNFEAIGIRKEVGGTWSNQYTYSVTTTDWNYLRYKLVGSNYENWIGPEDYTSIRTGSDLDIVADGGIRLRAAGTDGTWGHFGTFFVRKATTNEPTVTVGPERKVLRRW